MNIADRSFEDADFRVLRALNSEDFDFRTVDGLSRETGLTRTQVLRIISKNSDLIGCSKENDKNDRPLYYIHDLGLIVLALFDSEYDFRTSGGIAEETGIDEKAVEDTIRKNPEFVLKADLTTSKGVALYFLNTPTNRKRNSYSLI